MRFTLKRAVVVAFVSVALSACGQSARVLAPPIGGSAPLLQDAQRVPFADPTPASVSYTYTVVQGTAKNFSFPAWNGVTSHFRVEENTVAGGFSETYTATISGPTAANLLTFTITPKADIPLNLIGIYITNLPSAASNYELVGLTAGSTPKFGFTAVTGGGYWYTNPAPGAAGWKAGVKYTYALRQIGTIYAVDLLRNAIDEFSPSAGVGATPSVEIAGTKTTLRYPWDVALASDGSIAIAQDRTVRIFARGANGDVPPRQIISGAATTIQSARGVAYSPVSPGIYVLDVVGGAVDFFASTANGNTGPLRRVTNSRVRSASDIDVDTAGNLYVAGTPGVDVYGASASGSATPARTIVPPAIASYVCVDANGQVYLAIGNTVEVFAANSNGKVSPLRQIGGSATQIATISDVAVDVGGNLYVANTNGTIDVFGPTANGNVAPIRVVSSPVFGSTGVLWLAVQ